MTQSSTNNDASLGSDAGSGDGGVEDAAVSDAATGTDQGWTGNDLAFNGLPAAPASYTKCGEGTSTLAQMLSDCSADPWPLSGFPGMQSPSKRCDLLTASGADWQVWCQGGDVYFWIRVNDVVATSAYACPNAPYFRPDQAGVSLNGNKFFSAVERTVGDEEITMTQGVTLVSDAQDSSVNADPGEHLGRLQFTVRPWCNGVAADEVVVLGVDFSWTL